MKFAEFENKTISELYDMYGQRKKEQLNLRMQKMTGELKDTSRFRKSRREIAQIKTKLAQLKKPE